MKKHPLLWFYLLAFAISWMGWAPVVLASHGVSWFQHPAFQTLLILPAVGPALAAIIVQRVSLGKTEAQAWFRSLWRWQGGIWWPIIAVILPAVLFLMDKLVARTFGLPVAWDLEHENRVSLLIPAFIIALLSNPWEEVGWRGFALPRLQKNHTALTSTLIVGLLWALWHLPLFFWADNPMSNYPFLVWAVGTIAQAFIYTWLYNSAGGSVLIVSLYHVMGNTYGVLMGSGSVMADCIVNMVMAGMIIGLFGGVNLSRNTRVQVD